MRLVCPSCFAIHSAESFLNDEIARKCLLLITQLKTKRADLIVNYLSFFRPKDKALRWTKVLKLLQEIDDLLNAEFIKFDNKKAHYNNIVFWEQALMKIIDNPPTTLPLVNNNYLRAIAYNIADKFDAKKEKDLEIEKKYRYVENKEYTAEEQKQIAEIIEQAKRKMKINDR